MKMSKEMEEEMEEYFEYCRNKILAEMHREAEIDALELR